jgi:hypothetical protein
MICVQKVFVVRIFVKLLKYLLLICEISLTEKSKSELINYIFSPAPLKKSIDTQHNKK